MARRMISTFCVAILSLAWLSHAQDISPWIGQRVVIKGGVPLKVGDQVVEVPDGLKSYKVERANGEWLWLTFQNFAGWVRTADVVPFEQAINFYTQEIRSNPKNYSAYLNRGMIWWGRGEFDISISDYNEAIRIDPSKPTAYLNRGWTWHAKKEYFKEIRDYDESEKLGEKSSVLWNNRAWLWATCPDSKYRDGKRAVESSTRACEMSKWKSANFLDTLAAAYAEVADFEKAVTWQQNAVELLNDEREKEDYRTRLKLYKERKPYRDEG